MTVFIQAQPPSSPLRMSVDLPLHEWWQREEPPIHAERKMKCQSLNRKPPPPVLQPEGKWDPLHPAVCLMGILLFPSFPEVLSPFIKSQFPFSDECVSGLSAALVKENYSTILFLCPVIFREVVKEQHNNRLLDTVRIFTKQAIQAQRGGTGHSGLLHWPSWNLDLPHRKIRIQPFCPVRSLLAQKKINSQEINVVLHEFSNLFSPTGVPQGKPKCEPGPSISNIEHQWVDWKETHVVPDSVEEDMKESWVKSTIMLCAVLHLE